MHWLPLPQSWSGIRSFCRHGSCSTTAPLAKVSLGLWLIFNGLLLAALSMGSLMVSALMETGPQTVFVRNMAAVVSKLWTVATLLTVIGPILCLEFGAKSRSTWLLLATVVFQVSALVFGIRGESNSFEAGFASLLMLASVPLFFVFLRSLARTLERPELEQKTHLLLRGLINWVAMYLGAEFLRFFVSAQLPPRHSRS